MKTINTPQQNRLIEIAETANRANNYLDCDVVHDAITQVKEAKNKKEAIEAIDYVVTSLEYRQCLETCNQIELLKIEFLAYESLYQAISWNVKSAIDYFRRETAISGNQIRIM